MFSLQEKGNSQVTGTQTSKLQAGDTHQSWLATHSEFKPLLPRGHSQTWEKFRESTLRKNSGAVDSKCYTQIEVIPNYICTCRSLGQIRCVEKRELLRGRRRSDHSSCPRIHLISLRGSKVVLRLNEEAKHVSQGPQRTYDDGVGLASMVVFTL